MTSRQFGPFLLFLNNKKIFILMHAIGKTFFTSIHPPPSRTIIFMIALPKCSSIFYIYFMINYAKIYKNVVGNPPAELGSHNNIYHVLFHNYTYIIVLYSLYFNLQMMAQTSTLYFSLQMMAQTYYLLLNIKIEKRKQFKLTFSL